MIIDGMLTYVFSSRVCVCVCAFLHTPIVQKWEYGRGGMRSVWEQNK